MTTVGRDGETLMTIEVDVGFPMAALLDDEHFERPSLGFFHTKLPASIPLQTSSWLTTSPLTTY